MAEGPSTVIDKAAASLGYTLKDEQMKALHAWNEHAFTKVGDSPQIILSCASHIIIVLQQNKFAVRAVTRSLFHFRLGGVTRKTMRDVAFSTTNACIL